MTYPLNLSFKILALNPQIKVTDPSGQCVLYVKQKAFALKEAVKVFADEGQQNLICEMKADKIIDFSAKYTITSPSGSVIGSTKRQGMKSLWKATYDILDENGTAVGVIKEENPWLKVLDSLLSEIPFLGMLINPAYLIELRGQTVLRLQKKPAVMEGKFELEKKVDLSASDEQLLLPAIIMMTLLERTRG